MFDPRNPDDWADYPSYLASVQERARNRRREEARRQVKAMSKATPTAFEPLPVFDLHPVADIGGLYDQPRRHQHAASPTRSREIDALLAKLGIKTPRRRTRAASREQTVMRTRSTPVQEIPYDGRTISRSMGSVLRVR
jgi:hypothetical protein